MTMQAMIQIRKLWMNAPISLWSTSMRLQDGSNTGRAVVSWPTKFTKDNYSIFREYDGQFDEGAGASRKARMDRKKRWEAGPVKRGRRHSGWFRHALPKCVSHCSRIDLLIFNSAIARSS